MKRDFYVCVTDDSDGLPATAEPSAPAPSTAQQSTTTNTQTTASTDVVRVYKRHRLRTGKRHVSRPSYSPEHTFNDSHWALTQPEIDTLLLGTKDYVTRLAQQTKAGQKPSVAIADIVADLQAKGGAFAEFVRKITARKGGGKKISDRVRYEVVKTIRLSDNAS